MKKLILSFLAITISGCASTSFKPKIQLTNHPGDTLELEERAANMSWKDANDIVVINDVLPKGLSIEDGKVKVAPDFEYEIVGRVNTESNGKMNGPFTTRSMIYYFYDYAEDESWRKPLCWPQVPLIYLTFTLWGLVPTEYPCRTVDSNSTSDVANRHMRQVNDLKKAVKAAGATHLLVVGQDPFTVESTNEKSSTTNQSISFGNTTGQSRRFEWGSAWGLALRKKGVTAAALH